MNVFSALKLVGSAISFRLKDSKAKEKDIQFRRDAMYNENFMLASLRSQLEDVLVAMDGSDRTIDSVVISVDDAAIQYMSGVVDKMDCQLIRCATPGVYILEKEELFL